ncbi:hypothetical protein DNTS_024867 [Danionella cerebrum]|uniref:Uncharacterized protein n=1 Tax=Danionella cerebrum TaxID=2873325 RepID=A0A553QS82_9TELE|nr:hypothetical protein DNTS_024867 [Danionella translucida]
MQQSESSGGAATSEVQLNATPNALIACKVAEEVFSEPRLKQTSRNLLHHLRLLTWSGPSVSHTAGGAKPNTDKRPHGGGCRMITTQYKSMGKS